MDDVSGTARLVRENDLRLKEYEGTNAFYRIFFFTFVLEIAEIGSLIK